jgi:hypothetical protein
MKKLLSILLISLPSFMLLFCTGSASEGNKKQSLKANKGSKNNMVVMELFTSQGCSSCPPADKLLGKYANDQNVIALSFHVDYWDRLGWKDPFSDAAFSQRQRDYARVLKLNNIYTPQLIINGEAEMVGSNANKISAIVKQSEQQRSTSHLSIDKVTLKDNMAEVTYTLRGVENNSIVNLALVQSKASTSIRAGENAGVQLNNYNVVRSFKSIPSTDGTGKASIDFMLVTEKSDYRIVAFVQDPKTCKISSAAKSEL